MKLKDKLKNKNNDKKFKFLYRTAELLRLEHNAKGKEFRDGVITEAEWEEYKKSFFARHKKILNEINQIRDDNGLFVGDKQDEMNIHKNNGRIAQEEDADIDINIIEQ